jgi:hypothetical protein
MTDSCPPPGILPERLEAWERIVAQVESGYRLDLDDWLNDMDLRRALDETMSDPAISVTPAFAGRLMAIDRRFLRATADAGKCLWGAAVAAREGWHADRQWWYFRRPRNGNAALDREIDNVT